MELNWNSLWVFNIGEPFVKLSNREFHEFTTRVKELCKDYGICEDAFYNASTQNTFGANFLHSLYAYIFYSLKEIPQTELQWLDNYLNFVIVLLDRRGLDVHNEDYFGDSIAMTCNHVFEDPKRALLAERFRILLRHNGKTANILQKAFRRFVRIKKQHRARIAQCNKIIALSPPGQVEFCSFPTFPGGTEYRQAMEKFVI